MIVKEEEFILQESKTFAKVGKRAAKRNEYSLEVIDFLNRKKQISDGNNFENFLQPSVVR